MTPTKATTVLIVDRSDDWGASLRERLMTAGILVHVVNTREMALRFASVKIIDVAVVAYAMDGWTEDLCADFRRMGVPYVFTADMGASPIEQWMPTGLQEEAVRAH